MFQFPAAPVVGQLYTPSAGITYRFNGTGWVLNALGAITQADADLRYLQLANACYGSWVRYASGFNTGAAPNSQFTMNAVGGVLLQHSARTQPSIFLPSSSGNKVNDITVAGPVANGRDQAAALGNSVDVHFYWIYNPTTLTLATLSSLIHPIMNSGAIPTLPSGYTHWAYHATLFADSSGNLAQIASIRNNWVWLKAAVPVVTNGAAAAFTSITFAGVPGITNQFDLRLQLVMSGITTPHEDYLLISLDAVANHAVVQCVGNTAFATTGNARALVPNGNVRYMVSRQSSGGSSLANILVAGYEVPNGAV